MKNKQIQDGSKREITMDKKSEDKIETEVHSQQKFSVAGAIGRAGKGLLKGASPVSQQDQAINFLERWVDQNCSDPSGALKSLLRQKIRSSRLIIEHQQERPKEALATVIKEILATEFMLREFVRQVDVKWGELFQERPYFQKKGQEPHPKDEYTFDSVRVELNQMLSKLQNP
jgi:hypothetical protein